MKKKIVNYCQRILICLSFLLISRTCVANENSHEKTFYAISSLHFHLEEALDSANANSSSSEAIAFESEDIAYLWNVAASDPVFYKEVDLAQQIYYQADGEEDPGQSAELYKKTANLLKSIWEKLDSYLLEDTSTLLENKPTLSLPPIKYAYQNSRTSNYPNFDGNPYLTKDMRKKICPYLIPLQHPMKPALDAIFSRFRAIENEASFADAGFDVLFYQPYSFVRVARHPSLPGYLLKVYLDTEKKAKKNKPAWEWLVSRCEGAENVRNLIKKKNLRFFSVPDKWIYPLPVSPEPKGDLKRNRQPIILLVTDMQLVSHEECVSAWKNKITYEHLDELYCILSHGFASSHVVWNIPYSKSGKFTCIDTEHPKRKPNFRQVKEHLSAEMGEYWNSIVKKGGILGK